jgi:predicted DNA-binding transcriptional regulator YafY
MMNTFATTPKNPLPQVRDEGAWRVFPMEGALELHYRDVAGNPSRRRIIARELKVGPGKTLLGGIDMADDGYRGFRADRIDYVIDAETGQTIDRNILDWLIKRAEAQAKERARVERVRSRKSGPGEAPSEPRSAELL